MCPPPIDPIRPVNGLFETDRVQRAGLSERVHRRRPRQDEEPADEEHRRRPYHGPEEAPLGTYDDHGRADGTDEPPGPSHPHFDGIA